jgi:hypothetical protein
VVLSNRQRVLNSPKVGNARLTKYWYAPARVGVRTQWMSPSAAEKTISVYSAVVLKMAGGAWVQLKLLAAPSDLVKMCT